MTTIKLSSIKQKLCRLQWPLRRRKQEEWMNEIVRRFSQPNGKTSQSTSFRDIQLSQQQEPPIISFLCQGSTLRADGQHLLPATLLSSLVRQKNTRWELLIEDQKLRADELKVLNLWISWLRSRTRAPIRLIQCLDGMDSWSSAMAWSSGTYLMVVTPQTWLDPDLVNLLQARVSLEREWAPLVTLDAVVEGDAAEYGSARERQVVLGSQHDHWTLLSGWGPLPFLLRRDWLLRHSGFDGSSLADPAFWRDTLISDNLLPTHWSGVFASTQHNCPWPESRGANREARRLEWPDYTVVIPTWRRASGSSEAWVIQLLDQIHQWVHPPNEVIIVDALPDADQFYRAELEKRSNLQIVEPEAARKHDLDFAGMASQGINRATHALILLLADSLASESAFTIKTLLSPYIGSRFQGISSALIIDQAGTVLHRGVTGGLAGGIGLPGFKTQPKAESNDFLFTHQQRLVRMVTSRVMLIPKQVWEDLAGFNPALSEPYTSLDFCLRAGLVGHQVLYNGRAVFRCGGEPFHQQEKVPEDQEKAAPFFHQWSLALEHDPGRHPLRSRLSAGEEANEACHNWLLREWRHNHWLVIPIYGKTDHECCERLSYWLAEGFRIVLVNNNAAEHLDLPTTLEKAVVIVHNHNQYRLAGGLNCGMKDSALKASEAISLLDQDSFVTAESLDVLRHRLLSAEKTIWGPTVYDKDRDCLHATPQKRAQWFLMTSGTTLRLQDWEHIGPYLERMEIDYIDHEWSARAIANGYRMRCSDQAILFQTFGQSHPNPICRGIGINLYPPLRHQASIRNLILMNRSSHLPTSFKLKESLKMLVKPLFWLVCEPNRKANAQAILTGLWQGVTQEPPSMKRY